ncbi:MAG TPA: hypothetical protein GX497_02450 [Bacillus bacterium]|nr:hypothetical protein [Bacillus sp. (in: firmicutes)]
MDKEIIQYHFDELLKTLIILSSPAEKQKDIMGFGNVGEDMLVDFESHFNGVIANHYVETGFLSANEIKKLEEYDRFLDKKCNGQVIEVFTNFDKLKNNSVWEEIRTETFKLLKYISKDNLDIEITREIDKNLEWTITKLIKKK